MPEVFVVTNQAVDINGEIYAYPNNPNGTTIYIPCEQTEIIGPAWRIPQTSGGRVIGYNYVTANDSSVKPTADSLKVLSVKFTNDAGITQLYFAIADNDQLGTTSPPSQLAYLCNGIGGGLPVMPLVTIPTPILQTGPQSTDNTTGANTFIFSFPENPAGLEYLVNAVYLNGVAPTPAYVAAGITTVAGVAAYANTHWSDYGTWTNPSTNILKLVSDSGDVQMVLRAGIVVELAPVDFCFDLTAYSTPAAVNGVKFGTGNIIPVPAFLLTNNNVDLLNVLIRVMSSGTTYNTATSHKLGINTVMAQPKLYNNSTLVATAASGAC